MPDTEPPIVLETGTDVSASIVWLHGLGADGHDFEGIVPELGLPGSAPVRFVFPHAPKRPITINGGMVMRAWYDIGPVAGGFSDNNGDIRASAALIEKLIANEMENGVRADRIVLAGFSQGGVMALYTALGFRQRLAGVMALSAYLPMAGSVMQWASALNKALPVFQAHGLYDPLIPISRGKQASDLLRSQGYEVEWHEYAMAHSVCRDEIADLAQWLVRVLSLPPV